LLAANLYTRNINNREFINKESDDRQEAQMAKWGVADRSSWGPRFHPFVPQRIWRIELQLMAGSGSSRRCPPCAGSIPAGQLLGVLLGWAVGTYAGTAMAIAAELKPAYPLAFGGYTFPGYTAFYTLILNLVVAVVLDAGVQCDGPRKVTRPSRRIIKAEGSHFRS